jgi:histone-lysine N-methyltransferase SETMAR
MNSYGCQEMKSSRKRTIHNLIKKFMLTIVWNPRAFHLTKVLENDRKFNPGYCIAEIVEPLSQWRSIEAGGNERKLLVHADNARPHTAKLSTQYFNENRMKSAPYPPYSPDLAPSDFYLFGYVKRCLAGLLFEDADQLLAVVEGVLEAIEKATVQSGLSRVDGLIKDMYRYQRRVYGVRSNKGH